MKVARHQKAKTSRGRSRSSLKLPRNPWLSSLRQRRRLLRIARPTMQAKKPLFQARSTLLGARNPGTLSRLLQDLIRINRSETPLLSQPRLHRKPRSLRPTYQRSRLAILLPNLYQAPSPRPSLRSHPHHIMTLSPAPSLSRIRPLFHR